MYSFFEYFFGQKIPVAPPIIIDTDLLKEINRVKLKPIGKRPMLGRNIPKLDYDLKRLTDIYLKEILNVKLKHVEIPKRDIQYQHRHPVLRELIQNVKRKE